MFVFFSLLAASVDGFISGFLIGSIGVKFRLKDVFISFFIIFMCCMTASLSGNYLSQTHISGYINILGVTVMLWLAWSAIHGENNSISLNPGIIAISLSVAVDASVACLYLAMCGYNPGIVSATSAFLHSGLMAAGTVISTRFVKKEWLKYSRYIASMFFLVMAISKFAEI